MTRFYLYVSLMLLLGFTLVGATLIALGSTRPIHPALNGFVEGCEGLPQPCLYGIVPGVTTYEQAVSILEKNGYSFSYGGNQPETISATFAHTRDDRIDYCYEINLQYDDQSAQGMILYLGLQNCRNVYIQDFLAFFDSKIEYLSVSSFGLVGIYLSQGQIRINAWNIDPSDSYSLSIGVFMVHPQAYLGEQFRWHGFTPLWRYCQLEPDYTLCQ